MDYNAFAETIKQKHPEYADRDNLTLAQAVVKKYPQYADRVTFGNAIPGTPESQKTESPAYVPGQFPYEEEKKIWDQANKEGLDYYQAKQKVLEARNKYTQSRQSGGIGENIQGASGIVAGTALAPIAEAKKAVGAAGEAIKEKYPGLVGSAVGKALKFGSEAVPESPAQIAGQAGAELALPVAAAKASPVVKKALGFMAEKFGGLSNDVTATLEKNAPAVIKYARMGYEKASEEAASAAKRFVDAISGHMEKASDEYEKTAVQAVKDKYGPGMRLNLFNALGDTFTSIRQDFGFGDPSPLNFSDEAAQAKYLKVEQAATSLKDASVDEVYKFQKRLNKTIRDSEGSLKAALLRVKGATVKYLEDRVPEIQQGNEVFKAGAKLTEDLSRVENADNPVSVINSALRNKGYTRDAINKLISESPEAKSAMDDMISANAGKQVAHWTAQLPPTGAKALYQLGLGASGAEILRNPIVGVPGAAVYLGATSPRLYGEGFNILSKELPAGASRAAAVSALAAMRQRKSYGQNP